MLKHRRQTAKFRFVEQIQGRTSIRVIPVCTLCETEHPGHLNVRGVLRHYVPSKGLHPLRLESGYPHKARPLSSRLLLLLLSYEHPAKVVAFYLGFGPAERTSALFYHLTAEVNSVFGNSPLRSELTRHWARASVRRSLKSGDIADKRTWQAVSFSAFLSVSPAAPG